MMDGNIMAAKPKSKVWLWVLLAVVVIAVTAYVLFKYAIKDNVEPSGPSSADSSATTAEDNESEKTLSLLRDQYNWSTMQSGPYRDKVSFATSSDLLNWTDSGQVLAEHASVPDAVYKDGVIYIYFVDVSTDKKPEQIGMVKSTDLGKTWEPRQITKINGIGAMAPADPSPVLLDDGRIRLFFFDINRDRIEMVKNPPAKKPEGEKPGPADEQPTVHYIYSATSSDGINFIMDEGYRFASEEVFDPDVVKVGNTWHMYLGKQGNVAAATSTDGLTFTETGTALREAAIPGVIYENNKFYMFAVGEASKARGIGIFTSNDGKIFSSINKNFSGNGVNDAADPGVIELSDGTYLMAYKILTPPENSGKKNKE